MRTNHTLTLVVLGSLLSACCCFEPTPIDPDTLPVVREATIAEFNSEYQGNAPSPRFNIATYQFPVSDRSSGDLPNDERFSEGLWTFETNNYPLNGLRTIYEFATPPNSLIAGDLLVERIDLTGTPTAFVRVRGKLLRMPPNPTLLTDDANVFAREVELYYDTASVTGGQSVCASLDNQAIPFGTTIDDPQLEDYSIDVRDGDQPAGITYPNTWPTDSQGNLLPAIKQPLTTDLGYYVVPMQQGDWFYYKSVKGASFFVLVTTIQDGTLSPNIRRLTFKFTEAYGCYDCAE